MYTPARKLALVDAGRRLEPAKQRAPGGPREWSADLPLTRSGCLADQHDLADIGGPVHDRPDHRRARRTGPQLRVQRGQTAARIGGVTQAPASVLQLPPRTPRVLSNTIKPSSPHKPRGLRRLTRPPAVLHCQHERGLAPRHCLHAPDLRPARLQRARRPGRQRQQRLQHRHHRHHRHHHHHHHADHRRRHRQCATRRRMCGGRRHLHRQGRLREGRRQHRRRQPGRLRLRRRAGRMPRAAGRKAQARDLPRRGRLVCTDRRVPRRGWLLHLDRPPAASSPSNFACCVPHDRCGEQTIDCCTDMASFSPSCDSGKFVCRTGEPTPRGTCMLP